MTTVHFTPEMISSLNPITICDIMNGLGPVVRQQKKKLQELVECTICHNAFFLQNISAHEDSCKVVVNSVEEVFVKCSKCDCVFDISDISWHEEKCKAEKEKEEKCKAEKEKEKEENDEIEIMKLELVKATLCEMIECNEMSFSCMKAVESIDLKIYKIKRKIKK